MGAGLDLERRRGNHYRVLEGRRTQENENSCGCRLCLRLKPLIGIYSHEDETVDILGCVKATPIDGRGSTTLLIPRGTWP